MKKFLAIVAAVLLFGLCTTTQVPAQESKAVGQLMPDMKAFIEQNKVNTVQRVTPFPDGRVLMTLNMYKIGKDGYAQFVGVMAFAKCPQGEGSDIPFGVLLMVGPNSAVLMLDNAPTDGIIDEVVFNPQNRKILNDMPSCS